MDGVRTFHPVCVTVSKRRFFDALDAARQRAWVLIVVILRRSIPPWSVGSGPPLARTDSFLSVSLTREKKDALPDGKKGRKGIRNKTGSYVVTYPIGEWSILLRKCLHRPWAYSGNSLLW
jgi:hypothetical protein